MNNARRTKIFIGAMTAAGAMSAAYASFASHTVHTYLALAILALAAASSRMKVKLPGINGSMSVNLPFLLTAIGSLSAAEVVLVTCVSTAVQCWPRKNAKLNLQHMIFNLSMMAFASSVASLVSRAAWLHRINWNESALGLTLAAATLFVAQTVPVASIVAVSESKNAISLWWEIAHLAFPYYVVSAGVTAMVQMVGTHIGWELALGVFPVMYGIHRSYRLYFNRMTENMRPAVLVRAAGAGA